MTSPKSKAQERVIKAAVAWHKNLIAETLGAHDLFDLAGAVRALLAEREKGKKAKVEVLVKPCPNCGEADRHRAGWNCAKPKKGGRS